MAYPPRAPSVWEMLTGQTGPLLQSEEPPPPGTYRPDPARRPRPPSAAELLLPARPDVYQGPPSAPIMVGPMANDPLFGGLYRPPAPPPEVAPPPPDTSALQAQWAEALAGPQPLGERPQPFEALQGAASVAPDLDRQQIHDWQAAHPWLTLIRDLLTSNAGNIDYDPDLFDVAGAVAPFLGAAMKAPALLKRLPLKQLTGHLPYAPAARSPLGLVVSSRLPTSVKRPVIEDRLPLLSNLETVLQSKPVEKIAKRVSQYPLLTEEEVSRLSTPEVLDLFVDRLKDNYLWLYDQTDPDVARLSRDWYPGAHVRTLDEARHLRVGPEEAAAATARLSPQNEWPQNAETARRLGYSWREFADQNARFTPDIFDRYWNQIFAQHADDLRKLPALDRMDAVQRLLEKLHADRLAYQGKHFYDLPSKGQARMVRAFSELHHPKHYPTLLPSGDRAAIARNLDAYPTKLGWVPTNFIEDAIRALESKGDPAIISAALGDEMKVRPFYNNIIDPWYPGPSTVDTQAVAGGHLKPLGQHTPEVSYVMGGVQDNLLGLSGANPLYQEALNRAGAERGLLGREIQSPTWVSSRELFSDVAKRNKGFKDYVDHLWDEHRAGRLPIEKVREAILATTPGNRMPRPDWAP